MHYPHECFRGNQSSCDLQLDRQRNKNKTKKDFWVPARIVSCMETRRRKARYFPHPSEFDTHMQSPPCSTHSISFESSSISIQAIALQLLHLPNTHWWPCWLLHVLTPHASSAHLSEGLGLDLFKFLQADILGQGCVKQRHHGYLVALILHLCKEKDDFWPLQEWDKVEIFFLFLKRIVWDTDKPWNRERILLPATAIPASVLEEQYSSLWDSAWEKDSPLVHRPYHVAASADSWVKGSLCSAADTFCRLPSGAEGLSWFLTFLWLWPRKRSQHLITSTEASRHSQVISSVRGYLWTTSRLSNVGETEVHKIPPQPLTFYCGHYPPVWDSGKAWALFHIWGMAQLSQPKHSAEQKAVKLITLPAFGVIKGTPAELQQISWWMVICYTEVTQACKYTLKKSRHTQVSSNHLTQPLMSPNH